MHLPEERLQILGQLGSSGVPGIHRNEKSDAWSQLNLLADKVEYFLLGFDGVLDALDLDGDDRQHLDRDTVELVEAAPSTRLRQALVDVAHRLQHVPPVLLFIYYDDSSLSPNAFRIIFQQQLAYSTPLNTTLNTICFSITPILSQKFFVIINGYSMTACLCLP